MQQRQFLFLVLLIAVPLAAYGSGKIHGVVKDAQSGEPLIGATVSVVGTTLGAATSSTGEYTILNLSAGTYQLKAQFVGYQTITLSNVRVNNDLTTDANFSLTAEGVTLATVEITAQRPLVNKNATSAVRIIDNEFFDKLPARGIAAAIGIQPGVVMKGANVYIRGGRADETGFNVEGVSANNVVFGGAGITVPAEALEQTQVMAGGYNAEYGGANAGIVSGQLRTGNADGWKASLLAETDRFTSEGKKALGSYSYGYSDYTATINGPISGNVIRLFGSVENTFYRDPGRTTMLANFFRGPSDATSLYPSPGLWDGLDFGGANAIVTDPAKTLAHPNDARPDTLNLVYPAGNLTGGMANRYSYAGTLLFDLGTIQVRAGGTYSTITSRDPTDLQNIFNASRDPLRESHDGLANLKFTHLLTPTTFYEINLNYFNNFAVVMDPQLQYDINAYGDSAANAALGYYYRGNSVPYEDWSLFGGAPAGVSIHQPGYPQVDFFSETKQIGLGGKADITSQVSNHELKAGFEYTRYTVRRFAPGTAIGRAKIIADHPGDIATQTKLLRQVGNGLDNYGYDVWGNEIDNDIVSGSDVTDYGPRHPVFGAAYLQDKIEFSDIILNLGLRYDYINSDSKSLVDPTHISFNDSLAVISSSNIVNTPASNQLSPRIGFSFPVSDRTVFHAQYGKFIQQSRLRDTYLGLGAATAIVKGGFFVQNTSGYGLRPERTTAYEIGFAQQVSDVASFDITGFYKDITDQIQYTQILPGAGATQQSYPAFINGDFSTSKGIEFKFTLHRTHRVTAQLNYTFSDARSTGSNPTSSAGAVVASGQPGFTPKYVFPTTFNQPHRGSILLDYRFGPNDGGSILERLGLNLLAQFNSGYSFTRLRIDDPNVTDPRSRVPIEEIGSSSTPWFFQLDARLDKAVHAGPLDIDFYIYVQNLLGTDNAVNVFPRTGDPANDGWLSTPNGIIKAQTLGPQYVALYNAAYNGRNAAQGGVSNFGPPRQIRFGLKLDY